MLKPYLRLRRRIKRCNFEKSYEGNNSFISCHFSHVKRFTPSASASRGGNGYVVAEVLFSRPITSSDIAHVRVGREDNLCVQRDQRFSSGHTVK